jgi:hypothetical protein
MAKIMMYPKLHNTAFKAFEVAMLENEVSYDIYKGKSVDGEDFHCHKTHWFPVESDIDLPWHLAPEGTTHFDTNYLRQKHFHNSGWVKRSGDVTGRWNTNTQLWAMLLGNVNRLNLIQRPTEPGKLGEPTPEEDEAFNELDKKLNREPDFADTPFAVRGRILERMGKLMQDKSATVHDLAKVAAEARMSVYFKIQPIVE